MMKPLFKSLLTMTAAFSLIACQQVEPVSGLAPDTTTQELSSSTPTQDTTATPENQTAQTAQTEPTTSTTDNPTASTDGTTGTTSTSTDGTASTTDPTTSTTTEPTPEPLTLSSNADLASLSFASVVLDQSFSSDRTSYSASVANEVATTELTLMTADSGATVTVNGQELLPGQPTLVTLGVGVNLIEVATLAEDGVTQKSYFFTITRAAAPVAPTVDAGNPVAIDMTFHVEADAQKFLTLAAYSNDITYRRASYTDAVIDFGVRYDDAISSWDLQSLPAHGTLYEGYDAITSLPYQVSLPDELLYVPDDGFVGEDAFTFTVEDSQGSSNVGTISLVVETSPVMPAGIPALPAIFYTPRPVPASAGDTEGLDWYIDNSNPNATDEPRPGESDPRHGTPDTPRLTLPGSGAEFAAGARVFIKGGVETPYRLRNSAWHRWVLAGTAQAPVYVLGVHRGPNKPIILSDDLQELRLEMEYAVVDGLYFKGVRVRQRDDLGTYTGGNVVFKHCVLDRNFLGTSGTGLSLNIGDTKVLYDLHIKNSGRTEPDLMDENDVHGVQISNVSDYWILDNHVHHSAGDAIQINGEFAQGLYVGRNKLHSDNENALDFKRRYDLIFVENDVWDYRAIDYQSSGSDGNPVIVNQDTNGQTPTYALIARNRIWDANGAVRHQGNHIWTTDNLFWHIHHNVNSSSRSYTITVGNNAELDYIDRITNNTFDHVDGGVWLWAANNNGVEDHQYMGNVFGTLNEDSLERFHFRITPVHVEGTILGYNYYQDPAIIELGNDQLTLGQLNNIGQSIGSVDQIDPQFTDPARFDFNPLPGSPLIDAAIKPVTYDEIEQRYGISITLDNDLDYRPSDDNAWDVGAFEY